jgi:hypothetical protein
VGWRLAHLNIFLNTGRGNRREGSVVSEADVSSRAWEAGWHGVLAKEGPAHPGNSWRDCGGRHLVSMRLGVDEIHL